MNAVMYLKRLEDFTPRIAIKALKSYMPSSDKKHIRISAKQLNLIRNGINDDHMVKYVVSIGDALYQIVAVDTRKCNQKPVSVVVDYFQLSGTRRYAKEYSIKFEQFRYGDIALEYLKECITDNNSIYAGLALNRLNRIHNGICDSNMIKYVVSTGYGLYQIVAIEDKGIISVAVKYSQI